jgi:ubiquinone/menaquinone biosynthesis C-methylase UbiE
MPDKKTSYSREHIGKYFDDYGLREWDRMIVDPVNRISLGIHTHYLNKHISSGEKVLEIGAGAGRFTQILAGIGARIVVADISSGQLELNRKHAGEFGFAGSVLAWEHADISDLSQFEDQSFDHVVAYGGPFSYVLEKRDAALAESTRVLRQGGCLLLSVMSLWGTLHRFLPAVVNDLTIEENLKVVGSGDLLPETYDNEGHYMHMFSAKELQIWLKQSGLHLLDISASNSLTTTWNERLIETQEDKEKWAFLQKLELEACAQPGFLDGGTHILAVVQKTG